jgi:hypothetical protein
MNVHYVLCKNFCSLCILLYRSLYYFHYEIVSLRILLVFELVSDGASVYVYMLSVFSLSL